MRRDVVLNLIFAFVVLSVALGQNALPTDQGGSYLARFERAHDAHSVCVLLRTDGQYHLEHHSAKKVQVFEGKIEADDLESIAHVLSGNQISSLKQEQIADPMLLSDDDHVVLAIVHRNEWQQLSFPDSASRAPYNESLDPLLRWLDRLQKTKLPEMSEESARNNCFPARKLQLEERNPKPPPTGGSSLPAGAPSAPVGGERASHSYTLQVFDKYLGEERNKMTCVVVWPTGVFHLVKQVRERNSKVVRSAVLDGTLGLRELTNLRAILDAPELKKEQGLVEGTDATGPPGVGTPLYGGVSIVQLSIPRDGRIQRMGGWSATRLLGPVGRPLYEEEGMKILKPLFQWLDVNLSGTKAVPMVNPQNMKCAPVG